MHIPRLDSHISLRVSPQLWRATASSFLSFLCVFACLLHTTPVAAQTAIQLKSLPNAYTAYDAQNDERHDGQHDGKQNIETDEDTIEQPEEFDEEAEKAARWNQYWERNGALWAASGLAVVTSPLPLYAAHQDIDLVESLALAGANVVGSAVSVGGAVMTVGGAVLLVGGLVLSAFSRDAGRAAGQLGCSPLDQACSEFADAVFVMTCTAGVVMVVAGIGLWSLAPKTVDVTAGNIDAAFGNTVNNRTETAFATVVGASVGALGAYALGAMLEADGDAAVISSLSFALWGGNLGYALARQAE